MLSTVLDYNTDYAKGALPTDLPASFRRDTAAMLPFPSCCLACPPAPLLQWGCSLTFPNLPPCMMCSPNLISPNIQSSRLAWGDPMRAPHQNAGGDQRGTDFLHTEFYLTQASSSYLVQASSSYLSCWDTSLAVWHPQASLSHSYCL